MDFCYYVDGLLRYIGHYITLVYRLYWLLHFIGYYILLVITLETQNTEPFLKQTFITFPVITLSKNAEPGIALKKFWLPKFVMAYSVLTPVRRH